MFRGSKEIHMSTLIKQLAEQALKSSMMHDGVYRPEGYANSVSAVFADKFAELILAQFFDVCDDVRDVYFEKRKIAVDFNEKHMYAEGEAACDRIKSIMQRSFKA